MAWKLTYILGGSLTGITLLDSILGERLTSDIPDGFRYSIYFFVCCFMLFQLLRVYELYRKEKMANDKESIALKKFKKQNKI